MLIKDIFKNTKSRVWAIVTMIIVALLVVVTVLVSGPYYETVCMAIGGERTLGRGEGRYFDVTATSKEDAYKRGNALNEKICEEGFVLLKNNGALPLDDSEKNISVFGKNSANIVYGGTGSGGGKYEDAPTLYDSLESAGFKVNPTLRDFYLDDGKSGSGRTPNPKIENSGDVVLETGETPQSYYTQDIRDSYLSYNDAAIVVISRIGGEGFDLPRTIEGTDRHYLELDVNEEALINEVTSSFDKVIVVLNVSTSFEAYPLEHNDEVDAIVSMSGPGYSGVNALGRLLSGAETFSGKTADTWAADFEKDPTWVNFGNNGKENGATYYTVENGEKDYKKYYFVDYEEGIYLGYRYYETRGNDEGESWYDEQVTYPFGYGLSYTKFDWEILNAEELSDMSVTDENKNTDIEIRVKVTNTGDEKGKDVIQLYAEPPRGTLEKSSLVLVAFAKTPELYPADQANGDDKPNSCELTLKFDPYSAASYNDTAEGYYELEGGEYSLALKTNAHEYKQGIEKLKFTVAPDGVKYTADPDNEEGLIKNRFSDADEELDTVLSRDDWTGTWPTAADGHDLADYSFDEKTLSSLAHNNPETEWTMPETDVKTSKKLIEMKGLPYDDDGWKEILDSLSFSEMKELFNNGAFKTVGIPHIGLPATIASDGPVGFTNFISDVNIYGTVSYASEYVMGGTWNVDMLKKFGESVGEEAAYGKQNVTPYVPYSGWYAPGINLHRSPFGGRNFEYFSEDPLLSGKLAAAEIAGANEKGLVTYMKHFALNEQETYRDDNGVCTWATEQSIRELYLKPFEIAVKEGGATGIMTSFNRIGTVWTGGDYRLLTEVLKGEWGFRGIVITDFNVSVYMNAKKMIYAGGDLNLTTTRPWGSPDPTSASDVTQLRRASHSILYTLVNSNAMNGVTKDTVFRVAMPIWQIVLIVCDVVIVAGLGVWGFFEIRRLIRKRRETSDTLKSDESAGKDN